MPQYAYYHAVSPDGKSDGMWAPGFATFSIMVYCHHAILSTVTYNWTIFLSLWYLFSLVNFMPITAALTNIGKGIMQFTIFGDIMKEPQYWLSTLLVSGTLSLIYYGVRSVWKLLLYPQFY